MTAIYIYVYIKCERRARRPKKVVAPLSFVALHVIVFGAIGHMLFEVMSCDAMS